MLFIHDSNNWLPAGFVRCLLHQVGAGPAIPTVVVDPTRSVFRRLRLQISKLNIMCGLHGSHKSVQDYAYGC